MNPCALFIGRATIDVIYSVETYPGSDEKVTATRQLVGCGGPALNAAMTFSHLGGSACLLTSVGRNVLGRLIYEECERFSVKLLDRADALLFDVPVSTIVSTSSTGYRSIINAPSRIEVQRPVPAITNEHPQVVLLDQFEADAVALLSSSIQRAGVPVILDAGRWREATPLFLELTTIPIVSANFFPPGAHTKSETAQFLMEKFPRWAITCGDGGVMYGDCGRVGTIPALNVSAIDTLGAGDIFHGAFCAKLAADHGFVEALEYANRVAAESCKYLGAREWMSYAIGP